MTSQSLGRGKFASFLLLLQGLLLILFVVFVDYDQSVLPEADPDSSRRLDSQYGGEFTLDFVLFKNKYTSTKSFVFLCSLSRRPRDGFYRIWFSDDFSQALWIQRAGV